MVQMTYAGGQLMINLLFVRLVAHLQTRSGTLTERQISQ